MNHIEEIRKEIEAYFNPDLKVKDSDSTLFSPSNGYRVETTKYKQDKLDVNWNVVKVNVFDNQTGENLFSFFSNHGHFIHAWLEKAKIEYLICAEDIYGGQTIIDLTNRKIASYSPGEDGFIGTDYYLSPNRSTLGVIGCVWACPYFLKLFKFENPLDLPLTEFHEIEIDDSLGDNLVWVDEETIEFRDKDGNQKRVVKIGTAHNKGYKSLPGLE